MKLEWVGKHEEGLGPNYYDLPCFFFPMLGDQ